MLQTSFIAALRDIDPDITAEEIADILWLAQVTGERGESRAKARRPAGPSAPQRPSPRPHNEDKRVAADDTAPEHANHQTPAQPSAQRGAELHAWRPPSSPAAGVAGSSPLPFKTPATTALPGMLEIGRSFRSFRQRVPSRTQQRVDVLATARQIAAQTAHLSSPALPAPVLRPELRKWYDVFLVVDCSLSMDMWWQTITEWRKLLQMIGAFRTVRVWSFTTRGEELILAPGQKWSQDFQAAPNLKGVELPLTPGRDIAVLLVTDCVSAAWHDGIVADRIAAWGKLAPVTILNVLPRRLWRRTSLGRLVEGTVTIPTAGAPNARFTFDIEESVPDDDPDAPVRSGIPVPVVSLEPSALSLWSQAMTTHDRSSVSGYCLPQASSRAAHGAGLSGRQVSVALRASAQASPRELVRRFASHASPLARRLLPLLADEPISLPVVRLVQRAMTPEARLSHVAEVLMSGLIERLPADQPVSSPEDVRYDFVPGVRAVLRDAAPVTQMDEVLARVSSYVKRHAGQVSDFRAWVSARTLAGVAASPTNDRPFAVVDAEALRPLGEEYAPLANLPTAAPVEGSRPARDTIEVSDQSFEGVVRRAGKPVILMLWSPSEQRSVELATVFDSLAHEYRGNVIFARLDADVNPATVDRLRLRSSVGGRDPRVPTLLTFVNGFERKREIGVTRVEAFKKYVEDPIASLRPDEPGLSLGLSFGEMLSAFRARRGLTQSELAAASGRSLSYISALEHDHLFPTLDIITMLTSALGLSPAEERLLSGSAFDDRLTFPELLKKYRLRSGKNQSQLAQAAGIEHAIIRRLEAGRRPGHNYRNVVTRISRALGLTDKESGRLMSAAYRQRGGPLPASD